LTTIEERTAQREANLREIVANSRRLAQPADYVFDKAQEAFWDLRDGTQHSEKAVDASIPIELWRVEVDEGEEEAPAEGRRQRGRPRRRRERLIPPSRDIMRVENDQFVEGSTWWPGEPQIIKDIFIDSNGWRPAQGRRIYNKYLPPPELVGSADAAEPWITHVKKLWPDPTEHEFFFDFCAHMVQHPEVKCNAAIVLSGTQGIGKDAALMPVKAAVGNWNTKNIDPDELFSPYKPWLETLMLVVDEVRPTKDEHHASTAYNILKPMIVAPPDTLPLNDKYAKLRHIINRLRVFITTNDWMSMYIPPEDRRMFIMHSHLPQKWHERENNPSYFNDLFAWFEEGGINHVAAWLTTRTLAHFDPKAQVARTAGWGAVAASWGEPEDAIAWVIDHLGSPDVVLGQELVNPQFDHHEEVANMLKSPRKISHRMNRAGYVQVPVQKTPDNTSDRWVFRKDCKSMRSRYAFVKADLSSDKEHARRLVMAHGESLVAKMAEEKVIPMPSRKG
jgi:hypothetical protein